MPSLHQQSSKRWRRIRKKLEAKFGSTGCRRPQHENGEQRRVLSCDHRTARKTLCQVQIFKLHLLQLCYFGAYSPIDATRVINHSIWCPKNIWNYFKRIKGFRRLRQSWRLYSMDWKKSEWLSHLPKFEWHVQENETNRQLFDAEKKFDIIIWSSEHWSEIEHDGVSEWKVIG